LGRFAGISRASASLLPGRATAWKQNTVDEPPAPAGWLGKGLKTASFLDAL
jgi:hypothetical protein